MVKRFVSVSVLPVVLIVCTVLVVLFARGWRLDIEEKSLGSTGILVATSDPDGAQVYIDSKFSAATNSNINLSPGWYDISIVKDGYFTWERKMRIQGEVVVKSDAVLFLKNPSLAPLTSTAVSNPIISSDGTKIAYIASPSAILNEGSNDFEQGITRPTLFVYDLIARTLPFSKNPRPYEGTEQQLISEWEKDAKLAEEVSLRKMPRVFTTIATNSMKLLSFAPDDSRVLYQATASAQLERAIVPPIIGSRESVETRELISGKVYVYDVKEDRNYDITSSLSQQLIANLNPAALITPVKAQKQRSAIAGADKPESKPHLLFWLGTSAHLVLIEDKTIKVMDFEGSNKVTVYSGPFSNDYVYSHPSGRQLIIMTNLNPEVSVLPSLYTLNIR